MNDEELRAVVRDALARHLRSGPAPDPRPEEPAEVSRHVSHGLYLHLQNAGDACLIEPAVACTHCGYCKSHGY